MDLSLVGSQMSSDALSEESSVREGAGYDETFGSGDESEAFSPSSEREIIAFDSVNPAFTSVTLSTVTLKAFLQRIILTASFYFYFSSSYYLLVVE